MEGLQWLAVYMLSKKLRSKSKKKLHHWYDILGQMIAENVDGQPLIAARQRGLERGELEMEGPTLFWFSPSIIVFKDKVCIRVELSGISTSKCFKSRSKLYVEDTGGVSKHLPVKYMSFSSK